MLLEQHNFWRYYRLAPHAAHLNALLLSKLWDTPYLEEIGFAGSTLTHPKMEKLFLHGMCDDAEIFPNFFEFN